MKNEQELSLREAIGAYDFGGIVTDTVQYGSGHINDTYAVTVKTYQEDNKRFILQRINTKVFKNPVALMSNIVSVTEYLHKVIAENGGDPLRETLTLVKTKENTYYFTDGYGEIWRCYLFIEGTYCLQEVEGPEQFYETAKSFGRFLRLLDGYPSGTLAVTIEKFHDTRSRFQNFKAALSADVRSRADNVAAEAEFILKHEADCAVLVDLLDQGKLPLRVTHNDTKLNNILLDIKTGKGICIVDLDTIMPGSSLYDYGDSIRYGATTAAEDEQDLSKVHFDKALFEIFTKGYLEAAGDVLTPLEKAYMPWGAKLMTLECGMRFLTDYLNGDIYFKISRENQNLDRCRTQLKLVAEMEQCWDEMNEFLHKQYEQQNKEALE